MKFWKFNSYDIVRLFINQVGIAVFGSVLTLAIMQANEDFLVAISVFSVLFYLFLIYSVSWEIGSKERIRVDSGRLKLSRVKGLYLMLWAQIPNLIFFLLMIVGGIFFRGGMTVVGSRIYAVGHFPTIFFSSMYFGILNHFVPEGASYLTVGLSYLLTVIPALLVSFSGYFLGVSNRRILPVKKSGKRD